MRDVVVTWGTTTAKIPVAYVLGTNAQSGVSKIQAYQMGRHKG